MFQEYPTPNGGQQVNRHVPLRMTPATLSAHRVNFQRKQVALGRLLKMIEKLNDPQIESLVRIVKKGGSS